MKRPTSELITVQLLSGTITILYWETTVTIVQTTIIGERLGAENQRQIQHYLYLFQKKDSPLFGLKELVREFSE